MSGRKDIEIVIQHVKFVLKTAHHPPLIFVERYRPRKGDYEILFKLNVNEKLLNSLKRLTADIEKVLRATHEG